MVKGSGLTVCLRIIPNFSILISSYNKNVLPRCLERPEQALLGLVEQLDYRDHCKMGYGPIKFASRG